MELAVINIPHELTPDETPAPVDVSALRGIAMEDSPQVIDGLFPEGATLIYGLPKCGKSTLTTGVEMYLSMGYKMGGNLAGEASGRVQIIDMEGTAQLIRSTTLRYAEFGTLPGDSRDKPEHNPDADTIWFQGWPGDSFGERYNRLRKHLKRERDRGRRVRMLRIDTMMRFIGSPPQGKNAYEWTIECLGQLNELATDLEMAIIIIHHPNKLGEISGSNGIASSVTAIYQLKRDRETNEGLLICEGNRAGPERTWPLSYDPIRGTWDFDGELTAVQVETKGLRRKVADLLAGLGPMTGPAIREAFAGLAAEAVKSALGRMRDAGQVRCGDDGQWYLLDLTKGTPVPKPTTGTCVVCHESMTVIRDGQTMHPCCEPEPAPVSRETEPEAGGFNAYRKIDEALTTGTKLHPLWFIPEDERGAAPWPEAEEASFTAQHAHNWQRPGIDGIDGDRIIVPLDRHQSYPGSCNGVPLALGKLEHTGPLDANPKNTKQAGICLVTVPPWEYGDRIGHPLGEYAVPGESLWVPSGQVEQLWKLHREGVVPAPVVTDSWLGRRVTHLFNGFQAAVRDARAAAVTPEETAAIKLHSSVAIRKLHPRGSKSQWWRPDWYAAICSEALTRLWVKAWTAVQAGDQLAGMGKCDAVWWITPEGETGEWLPSGYVLGDGPGTYHLGSIDLPRGGGKVEGPTPLHVWLQRSK